MEFKIDTDLTIKEESISLSDIIKEEHIIKDEQFSFCNNNILPIIKIEKDDTDYLVKKEDLDDELEILQSGEIKEENCIKEELNDLDIEPIAIENQSVAKESAEKHPKKITIKVSSDSCSVHYSNYTSQCLTDNLPSNTNSSCSSLTDAEVFHNYTSVPGVLLKSKSKLSLYCCEVCCKIYRTRKSLQRHELTHLNTNSLEEDENMPLGSVDRRNQGAPPVDPLEQADVRLRPSSRCGRVASNQDRNVALKRFMCVHCDYRTDRKSLLTKHMIIHVDIRPYKCDVCFYKFKVKAHLKEHMKSHSGEKPFNCSLCSFKCRRKIDLKVHIASHSIEKKVHCPFCEYKCKTRNNLYYHLKRWHPDKNPKPTSTEGVKPNVLVFVHKKGPLESFN